MELKIGLLGLQGAIEEHEASLRDAANKLNLVVTISRVTLPEHLEELDGIVMPGGESTAMIKQGNRTGLLPKLKLLMDEDFPAFGTCAGAILLAKETRRNIDSPVIPGAFPYLEMQILRNGYGTQRDSFSTKFKIKDLDEDFEGVFIRAPIIENTESGVEVLSKTRGHATFVRKGNIMATTFHPELTEDSRIHQEFLKIVRAFKANRVN